jgi:ABC-type Fe3+-hydroxamate transport system substrate-binding protein
MGRPVNPTLRHSVPLLSLLLALVCFSCDRSSSNSSAPGKGRRVASLVPAATDMLIGIGAKDHLVAVSNFESSPAVKDLPRVGDYQTTDWETIARLRPDAMVIQMAPDRVPPGLKQRAEELKIELVNVKIHRLEDVFDTMQQLGAVAGERDKGRDAVRKLRERFDRLREQSDAKPPLRVLIVRDENGQEVIGPDNYLDDLLKVVNATNAARELGKPYPSVDREKLAALAPEAVIVLLPDARPQTIESVRRFWASMPDLPATKAGRISIITDAHAQVPGSHLADLAQTIADHLRPPPPPSTAPATTKAAQ